MLSSTKFVKMSIFFYYLFRSFVLLSMINILFCLFVCDLFDVLTTALFVV